MHFSRIWRFACLIFVLLAAGLLGLVWWSERALVWTPSPIEFTIAPGHSMRLIAHDVAAAGVPVQPLLLNLLARIEGRAQRLQAGTYSVASGTTPNALLEKMERGDVVQIELVIPEGWTFHQLRSAVAADPDLKQTLRSAPDPELLTSLGASETNPEGLFGPGTYRFARGTSDLELYRRAYRLQQKRLTEGWAQRAPDLPLSSAYDALILASIVEKETARPDERPLVAAVFLNRMRRGMMLQTDPTVIYGLGGGYDGTLHKRDLMTDTPYNTYTRVGLPPTPIALPGAAALAAVLNPSASDALYFVSRGDGTSEFSANLEEHNRAVLKYQKGARP